MDYRFIDNIGEYFNPGFFTEDFYKKVEGESGKDAEELKSLRSRFSGLNVLYKDYKNSIVNGRLSTRFKIHRTHEFNTHLLKMLGYDGEDAYKEWLYVDESSVVPVRHIIRDENSGHVKVVIMEMQPMIAIGDNEPDGLFNQYYDEGCDDEDSKAQAQKYRFSDWKETVKGELPDGVKIRPAVINRAVDEIFQLSDEKSRPQFMLILAGNKIFLLDVNEWYRGSYVVFDIDELLIESTKSKNVLSLLYLLISRESLTGHEGQPLTARVHEASVRNAIGVTRDLKEGVISAVERIANEAIFVLKQRNQESNIDATQLRDDALTFVYRLLFLFYAEARPELGILPMRDEAYLHGYSLEMIRDLEQVPMQTQESKNGFFFDTTIRRLFHLIHSGYNDDPVNRDNTRFTISRIDSPLFDDSKLNVLADIPLRNHVWQKIIESLSLSQEKNKKRRGRISYANLGINQLGSVYESLLAYRGFYTDEDYIEVFSPNSPEETYLVPRRRMDDFDKNEILLDENGREVVHKEGLFLYRLNGRDRKKSASYYTPEVLTKSTVKYTLKGFRDKLDKGEMGARELLELKILEPAMGAAAFQNEVINQLAEMYIDYRQQELKRQGHKNWRIPSEQRHRELQKVKAYIAVKNTYGVDLNRTAIELGKLALWLNVMYAGMETPWFAHHLAWGNAVIGAWFKTVEVVTGKHDYTQRPVKIQFTQNGKAVKGRKKNQIYHFLLPDPAALGILKDSNSKKQADTLVIKRMQDMRKDWIKPLDDTDIAILQRLSARIDTLIAEAILKQLKVDRATEPAIELWGVFQKDGVGLNFDYGKKQSLTDSREWMSEAHWKLKTAMDYWCALFFWRIEDADRLPDRRQFWADVEQIIGRNPDTPTPTDRELYGMKNKSLFPEYEQPSLWDVPESDEGMIAREKLEEYINNGDTQKAERSPRQEIVARLAGRYRFFHPMLEFIEVFSSRGGFDIIAGNPPWLKLTFTNEEVAADFFPEVMLHNYGGPKTSQLLPTFMQNERFADYYTDELYEYQGSIAFMNADVNYTLLKGQQTNLYKCVLVNGFDLLNEEGFMGMLHPEGVYEDPNGQILRKEIYQRLRYHFQYVNQINLFPEVSHTRLFGTSIYGCEQYINFYSISNLFNPATIDDCFSHSGFGRCGGIKNDDGGWNIKGHSDRIVKHTPETLKTIAKTFEDESASDCCKLVSIHNRHILDVLDKLSNFPENVSTLNKNITECLHEALAVTDDTMCRETRFPDMQQCEMIFNGPHIYGGNPLYKTPREVCTQNSHYDTINLSEISDNYIPRTNFVPVVSPIELNNRLGKFGDNYWMEYYHVAFRKMLDPGQERTLNGAIIPPKTSHTNGIISITFPSKNQTVELAGLTSSIVFDFYIKTIGAANLYENRINSFPIGIDEKFRNALYVRTLMLNCLTVYYAPLWADMWQEDFKKESWSIDDDRLKPFSSLTSNWQRDNALRNYFERRQALVEIDVITAMALGLSLDDLEMIYTIQFPVLQQNENETYYDADGNIAFTVSRGLTGVGMSRQQWDAIPDKSDYTLCDRIVDYRCAWPHFEKIFSKE